MKKLGALLLFTCAVPSYGEIVFDWKYTSISQEKQQLVEERTKAAATKYMDIKYTAFGIEAVMDWGDIPLDDEEQLEIENKIKAAALCYEKKDYKGFEEELRFDWKESALSEDITTQKIVEERARNASIRLAEKRYSNYGPYNFFTAKERYHITVMEDIPQYAEIWGARYIILNNRLVNKPELLELVIFHELSHAYDFYVADNLLKLEFGKASSRQEKANVSKRKGEFPEIIHNIKFSSELRSQQRTKEYANEIHAKYDTKLEHFREGGDIEHEETD